MAKLTWQNQSFRISYFFPTAAKQQYYHPGDLVDSARFINFCWSSWFLTPTSLSTWRPSLKKMNVGVAFMSHEVLNSCIKLTMCMSLDDFGGVVTNKRELRKDTGNSSTSTVRNIIEVYLSASSWYPGAAALHGLHHDALKFTTACWKTK